jgi:hypothetical protein
MPKEKLSPEGEVIAASALLWSRHFKCSSTTWRKATPYSPDNFPTRLVSTWKW